MKHWTAALKEKKLLLNFFKRLRLNETERYKEFQYISLCGRERNFVRCLDRPFVFNVGKWRTIVKCSLSISCLFSVDRDREDNWVLQYNNAGDTLVMVWYSILLTQKLSECLFRGLNPVKFSWFLKLAEFTIQVKQKWLAYSFVHSSSVTVTIMLLSGPPLCGGVGLISDKLSILWTQEQRFVFGDGDTAAPTSFVWDNCEHQLDNSLLEVILRDKERGIGFMGEVED